MWLTPVITSGPCGQIPPHRVAFIVFFFFFPSSKLTPVTDWLDDLSIDLPDPSRALPSDAPDGRSFHRSLRRILSCISQDKQALMAKGKARRNRGVSPPPKQTSQHGRVVGADIFNLNLCQCGGHACSVCFTHAVCTRWHARHNQIVVWQQYWLLYLPCCYSNKHPSLSPICCAKQSPYQHLAHHTALCQSGPRCQDRQPATEAQTHSSSLRLPHGCLIIPLSLPHKATEGEKEKKRSVDVHAA